MLTLSIDSGKVTFKKLLWRRLFGRHEMFIIFSCDYHLWNFSHKTWSKFWFDWYKKRIYQTGWLHYIDGDLSNFNLCLYLIEISASQEYLIVFMDNFVLVLNMNRHMNKGAKKGKVHFLKGLKTILPKVSAMPWKLSHRSFWK